MDGVLDLSVKDAKGKLLRVRWQRTHCALEEGISVSVGDVKGYLRRPDIC